VRDISTSLFGALALPLSATMNAARQILCGRIDSSARNAARPTLKRQAMSRLRERRRANASGDGYV
jgi:hypothetical protein